MISSQPVFSLRYFDSKKRNISKNVKKMFYLSWEDALWDLLKYKKISAGSHILLPEFFCGDVEENIKNRGYQIIKYKVDSNLVPSEKSFFWNLKKYQPKVVVIFHAVGIQNILLTPSVVKKIPDETLLIEDCVHRIVDVSKIKILKKNHFLIDSLRKVVPIQGARIFGRACDFDFSLPSIHQSFVYSLLVHVYWILMVLMWQFSFGFVAEKLMIKGYDLIGDKVCPAKGLRFFDFLSDHLNIEYIESVKCKQVTIYERELKKIKLRMLYNSYDKGKLRGWPIVLNKDHAHVILNYLRYNKIALRFELDDSEWSIRYKIIYLPMGLHIKPNDQKFICKKLIEAFDIV